MYADTRFNWFDNSQISSESSITELNTRPLFATVFTADKGTEKVIRINGRNFYNMFGETLSFEKHGQPLLQAARIIDAGGELLAKRIVSDDATLSNLVLVANVNTEKVQKKDSEGNLIYIDSEGNETTSTTSTITETTSEDVESYTSVGDSATYDSEVTYYKHPESYEEVDVADEDDFTTKKANLYLKVDDEYNKVADDATYLSHNTYYTKTYGDEYEEATVTAETFDSLKSNLYVITTTTNTTETTTEVENLALMIDGATTVKWEAKTVENCATTNDVKEAAEELFDEENGVFPVLIITDIGRNKDCKSISIIPDYDISRSTGLMFYRVFEYEDSVSKENVTITINPGTRYNNKNYGINPNSMGQVVLDTIDGVFDAYVKALADVIGISEDEMKDYDIINLTNRKGISLNNISITDDSANLSATYGIGLLSGSDGTLLGDKPIENTAKYSEYAIKFFKGQYDEQVFDIDVNKIYAVVDANYPDDVKEAITEFANFREDFMFFEDLGLHLNTFDLIYAKKSKLSDSKFVTPYMTSYKVNDPYSNKRIDVTLMYDLAPILVNHFSNHPSHPVAGEVNGFSIYSAIPGTVNYIPRRTPTVDQKDLLEEARINYATYNDTDGPLVINSLYTAQQEYTQLSYANNVLAIQEVMRALRIECPKNRFRFTNGNDFTVYHTACEEVLNRYRSNFSTLNFTYLQDSVKESQKIYYAAIEFAFNNWNQAEIFDLYAIPTTISDEEE